MIQLFDKYDYSGEYDEQLDIVYCYVKSYNELTKEFEKQPIEKWMKTDYVKQIWNSPKEEFRECEDLSFPQFESGVVFQQKKICLDRYCDEYIEKMMPISHGVRLLDASKYKELSFKERIWGGVLFDYLSRALCAMHVYIKNKENNTEVDWEKVFYNELMDVL